MAMSVIGLPLVRHSKRARQIKQSDVEFERWHYHIERKIGKKSRVRLLLRLWMKQNDYHFTWWHK